MSAGYASRLSEYRNKGVCGLPEYRDTSVRTLNPKLKQLSEMVKDSKHLVILTGAGISTSAGIPDFRGPKGVWTLEKESQKKAKTRKGGKAVNNDSMRSGPPAPSSDEIGGAGNKRLREEKSATPCEDFTAAKPTLTHRAISRLASDGVLKYCITQNVDGLHRRSGLSRSRHSVLHGCVFTEKCEVCDMEYFRDFDVGGMSFQKTGRKCSSGCQNGDLRDILLDWEDTLPEYDFSRATEECEKADLVICLGTSLRMKPADSLPLMAKKFVIVNLQMTPYDEKASLIIRSPVDVVMKDLMERLGYSDDWIQQDDPPAEALWRPAESK